VVLRHKLISTTPRAVTRSCRPDGAYDVGDISPETLSAVVDFCYAGALPQSLTSPAALAAIAAHNQKVSVASAQTGKKPNILCIWGDDIGTWNISHTNRGMMGYKTPNIDRIAKEGVGFTDYYAQQSCTAGRAAFISGSVPVRSGMTKVGLPGAALSLSLVTALTALEFLVAFLQAFVFAVLTCVYLNDVVNMGDHH
jgi:hypothetical protein